jgi:predicted transcriptional regulator/predicted RNA-binding Zn-ribbon protein involved in translation (DUF1610 family)
MTKTSTKLPCELIIWYVVPDLRSEISRILKEEYNYKQVEIAEVLGVTKAAVNQYLSSKRGDHFFSLVKDKKTENQLMKEVRKAVVNIANDQSTIDIELCRICNIIKGHKIIQKVYDKYAGGSVPECLMDFGAPVKSAAPSIKTANIIKCTSCKKDLDGNWIACPFCGEKVAQKCPGCRGRVEMSWKVCPHCAKKLKGKDTKKKSSGKKKKK